MPKYPLAILGAGMAGLTASLYASRYNIKHILIGKIPGGKALDAVSVENYPGFKQIPGADLMKKVKDQVFSYQPEFVQDTVRKVLKKQSSFEIVLASGKKYESTFLLLALGTKRRKLNVPGEKELEGRGVHFCATCDGYFYKDKIVMLVGGGNAGVTAALMLSDLAKKVLLVEVMDRLAATPIWQERLKRKKNVEIWLNTKVKEFKGKDKLEKVEICQGNDCRQVKVDGVFIEIGALPNNRLAKQLGLKLDEKGYVVVSSSQRTSNPKVFAAGDFSTGSNYFQQLLTSAAEGAIAVESIYKELNSL